MNSWLRIRLISTSLFIESRCAVATFIICLSFSLNGCSCFFLGGLNDGG